MPSRGHWRAFTCTCWHLPAATGRCLNAGQAAGWGDFHLSISIPGFPSPRRARCSLCLQEASGGCQALPCAFLQAFHYTQILSPREAYTAPPLAGKAKRRKGKGCRRAGSPAWRFTMGQRWGNGASLLCRTGAGTPGHSRTIHTDLCYSSQPKITTDEERRLSGMH